MHLVVDQQAQALSQQAQIDQTQSHNEQLQRQVAALQPLAGRLRVQLRSWRAQRAARSPHDAPPSDAAVAEMGLTEAVAALQAHVAVARLVERMCERLQVLCATVGSEHAAAEAGAMEVVVAAMWTHLQVCTHAVHTCGAHVRSSFRAPYPTSASSTHPLTALSPQPSALSSSAGGWRSAAGLRTTEQRLLRHRRGRAGPGATGCGGGGARGGGGGNAGASAGGGRAGGG